MSKQAVRWDEPRGCTTPRGWCYIDGLSVTWEGQKPCGFYLTYSNNVSDGKPVFAKAYLFRDMANGHGTIGETCADFKTVTEAKRWVTRTARRIASQAVKQKGT